MSGFDNKRSGAVLHLLRALRFQDDATLTPEFALPIHIESLEVFFGGKNALREIREEICKEYGVKKLYVKYFVFRYGEYKEERKYSDLGSWEDTLESLDVGIRHRPEISPLQPRIRLHLYRSSLYFKQLLLLNPMLDRDQQTVNAVAYLR